MSLMRGMSTNLHTARELLRFVWRGTSWWLAPIVVVLLLLTGVVVVLEGSALAPFIYTLF